MEVIEVDDDDDDDFIHSVNPSAVRKSTSQQAVASSSKNARGFRRPPPIKTNIDSDPILKESTSSSSIVEDECPICSRDLRLLNEQRRTLHLNACLDEGEAKSDLDKNMEKWKSTVDCPVCKTPLAAGPFRSAHIKKCGREHAINGRDLLALVTTQEKVAETRRKRALPHTSAKTPKLRPKKVSKLDEEPKNMAEEELIMAKALSASLMEPGETEKGEEDEARKKKEKERMAEGVSPQFTRIINENIRKRRSYAVVELAPRGCKCDVIELIQSRFLRVFRPRRSVFKKKEEGKKMTTRDEGKKDEEGKTDEEPVKQRLAEGEKGTRKRVEMEATMANTLFRLDSLSWAYRKLATEGEERGDVSIECTDGQLRAFSWSLAARTTALGRVVEEGAKISIDQPITVVRHWLQYVHSARIEWAAGPANEGMREIAKQHGPEGLMEECARMTTTRREYAGFGRIGAVREEDEKDTVVTVSQPATTVPPAETPEDEPEVVVVLQPTEEQEQPLPSDDARMEENEEQGTVDSEGSMRAALKNCAADGRAAAHLSPRPLDGSFLAALAAPPPPQPPIIDIATPTPATTTTVPPMATVPQESPKDSFFESIVYGDTPPARKEAQQAPPPTVIPLPTAVVPQRTDPSDSAESMDESDAMRNILDVSCLRRSPRIRVGGDEKETSEGKKENALSPVLFDDSDDDECMEEGGEEQQRLAEKERQEMSPRVPSPTPPPRRSPRRSITAANTVTPKTSRTSLLRKSILALRKEEQEVIYLEDTPLSSPVTVAKPPSSTVVSIEKKEEEETTVDETFPRLDVPSYGQGGMDTVDGEGEGEEARRADSPMDEGEDGGGGDFEYDYHYNEDYGNDDYGNNWHDEWNGGGEQEEAGAGGETDAPPPAPTSPSPAAAAERAQEEVDSFLLSLRFNETRAKSASPPAAIQPPPTDEVDSFLLSFMGGGGGKEKEQKEDEGAGDILGALSPMRKEAAGDDEDDAFKTPTIVRGGRGRGGGARGGRGAVFGSHVKVLKWSNVTPKPRFEAMDDAALKTQLARYGLRPMGRKRAIAMLTEIYEQTHPVVDESAAAAASSSSSSTAGPSTSRKDTVSIDGRGGGGEISPTRRKTTIVEEEEGEEEENDGEKTLNRGSESSDEDHSDRAGGGGVGEAEESMIIPKAVLKGADSQLVLFLEWLRLPAQKDLYDHCLALKSISLEELEVKLKRADSALCGVSRKVLMCVLDRLHITYSLPQDGWKKKRKGNK